MTQEHRPTTIVVAVDGSTLTKIVTTKAIELATTVPNPKLHVLHIVVSPAAAARAADDSVSAVLLEGARSVVEDACSELRHSYFGALHAHVGGGDPAHEIVTFAGQHRADYVVLGTHGRTGIPRLFLGSVAEKVVRTAPCSVLVAREVSTPLPSAPDIEPPCEDCLIVRRESAGKVEWCARHSVHHVRARLHFQVPQRFAVGSMLLRPE